MTPEFAIEVLRTASLVIEEREALETLAIALAKRSADKARIAAAEGVAEDLRNSAKDTRDHGDGQVPAHFLDRWAARLSQPADPNSSATRLESPIGKVTGVAPVSALHGWMPIGSAPKDNSRKLHYLIISDGVCLPDIAIWRPEMNPLDGNDSNFIVPEGWFCAGGSRSRVTNPILWQPCPENPNDRLTQCEQVEVVGYWDGESEVFSKSVDSGPDDEPLVYKSDYDALRAAKESAERERRTVVADLRDAQQCIYDQSQEIFRLSEALEKAERERDAYRVRLAALLVEFAGWASLQRYDESYDHGYSDGITRCGARVAEIIGGANGR